MAINDLALSPKLRAHPAQAPVDIYIVHTDSEWQLARSLASLMTEIGYTVAPADKLGLQHDAARAEPLPADARAVVVIWPLARALFPKPALEARAAAQRGHLVQIYAGQERPEEDYGGDKPVDFASWDYAAAGLQWKALLRRLRPLCGPPPRPKLDVAATTQTAVLCATVGAAVAGMIFALGQGGHEHNLQAAPHRPLNAPETEPVRLATDTPVRPAEETATVEAPIDSGLGGPEAYDTDLGYDVGTPPATGSLQPPPAAPAKRAPQGPEQF